MSLAMFDGHTNGDSVLRGMERIAADDTARRHLLDAACRVEWQAEVDRPLLSPAQVQVARYLRDNTTLSLREVADCFGSTAQTVQKVGRRVNWKHVPEGLGEER